MSDFTQRFLDAMNSHDAARLAACYAEDATHEDLALGVFYEGRNAIKASIEEAEKYSNEYQFTLTSAATLTSSKVVPATPRSCHGRTRMGLDRQHLDDGRQLWTARHGSVWRQDRKSVV